MELLDKRGNIFTSSAEAFLIPVNCEGYMGAGLALESAVRFPDKERDYKNECLSGNLIVGKTTWQFIDQEKRFQVLFPTKNKYSHPSRLSFIESGMRHLVQVSDAKMLKTVAIPRLGADLGKLDWESTRPVIEVLLQTSEHLKCIEFWEFDPKVQDDLFSKLKILVKCSEWDKLKFLNRKDKENILLSVQLSTDLSFMSLLRISGISKSKLTALAEFIQNFQKGNWDEQLILDLPNG